MDKRFGLAVRQSGPEDFRLTVDVKNDPDSISYSNGSREPAQLYGEPIDFRGLRHAPINEQGVVYLFGMVSRELGFYIEAINRVFRIAKANTFTTRRRTFGQRRGSNSSSVHPPSRNMGMIKMGVTLLCVGSMTGPIADLQRD